MPSKSIHIAANDKISLFLMAEYFSVCVYICVCTHKHTHICLCTHTTSSLCIHLTHGHLGCQVPSWQSSIMLLWAFRISVVVVVFFLSVFPGVEFLIFWEASILFSIVAAPIYIPLQPSMKIPLSLHPWQDLLCSLWWQSFWQVWSDISLWFWFPWW